LHRLAIFVSPLLLSLSSTRFIVSASLSYFPLVDMGGVANFAILTRHLTSSGPLPTLTDHAPNSEEYTYISSAISLAIRVMGTPQCQNAMTELAMSFDALRMHSTLFQGNYNNARQTVRGFVDVIAARFPIVCIDQRLTGSAVLGYHQRAPWNGQFNPRNQWVFINSTVRQSSHNSIKTYLANPFQQARNMIQGAGTGEAFRIFQFKLACTLIHETAAHMLVTFLGRGGSTTPPGLTVAAYSGLQPGGESGRFLEMELFGGCLEFFRDPARGANHVRTYCRCMKWYHC
jgi:hypothetical protein